MVAEAGEQPNAGRLVKIRLRFPTPICRSTQILGFFINTAIRRPRLTAAVVFLLLAALASTMTYTGFLVVGVLAEYLGTGRVAAGLLLGALFARFPWVSKGKLRIVGVLPKPARRPLILGILALCLLHFLMRSDYVSALFVGFGVAFLLGFPRLRRVVVDRVRSSFSLFTGRQPSGKIDDSVIEGEFREKKD